MIAKACGLWVEAVAMGPVSGKLGIEGNSPRWLERLRYQLHSTSRLLAEPSPSCVGLKLGVLV